MPDWINWLTAITGIFGFCFSIWIYFRERKTRNQLIEAKKLFQTQQDELISQRDQLLLLKSDLEKRSESLKTLINVANGQAGVVK